MGGIDDAILGGHLPDDRHADPAFPAAARNISTLPLRPLPKA